MTAPSRVGKARRAIAGFSLIELLCVLVILIILAVIMDSSLSGSRHHTNQELCRKNLQTISLAMNLYANDNQGAFPFLNGATNSSGPLSLLLPRSTTETAIFICPGSGDKTLPEGESFAQRRISYAYYMGRATNRTPAEAILSDWQVNTLPKTKGQPLFSPDGKKPANNHGQDGGNLLLGKGEVIRSGPAAARDLPVPSGVTLLNPATMNIKIECACGTRYSFEVEPRDGRMPWTVQCPACQADGTEAANRIIAATGAAAPPAPRLRIHRAPPGHRGVRRSRAGTARRARLGSGRVQSRQAPRRGAGLCGEAAGFWRHRRPVLALAGGWGWYAFAGSKPHLAASLKMPEAAPARIQFLGPDKILIVTPAEASLRDLSLKKVCGPPACASRRRTPPLPAGASAPPVFADPDQLWICLGDQVKTLDPATGAVKQTVPITGRFVSFTPADTSLLVVSAPDETRRIALRIELSTGAVSSQEITVPRKRKTDPARRTSAQRPAHRRRADLPDSGGARNSTNRSTP